MSIIDEIEKIGFTYLHQSTRACYNTPKISGVYCFIDYDFETKSGSIIYIGKSKKLSVRLKPWHKVEYLHSEKSNWPICYVLLTSDLDRVEVSLIERFTPIYNVQHNPNIKRKIIYENGKTIY